MREESTTNGNIKQKAGSGGNGKALLDSSFVQNRIKELELRQWWIAEQIGVSQKTIMRWANGKVRYIGNKDLENLSEILDCTVNEIIVKDPKKFYATKETQDSLLKLLSDEKYLHHSLDVGRLKIFEVIMKSAMTEDIPILDLAKLYLWYGRGKYHFEEFEEAIDFTKAALDCAKKVQNKYIIARSLAQLGLIYTYLGRVEESKQAFEDSLKLVKYLKKRDEMFLLGEYSILFLNIGDFVLALDCLKPVIQYIDQRKVLNRFSTWTYHTLAATYFDMGDYAASRKAFLKTRAIALKANETSSEKFAYLYLSKIEAITGNPEKAKKYSKLAMRHGDNHYGYNHWVHLRVRAYINIAEKKYEEAKTNLLDGIKQLAGSPLFLGTFSKELSEVFALQGNSAEADRYRRKANQYYLSANAKKRMISKA